MLFTLWRESGGNLVPEVKEKSWQQACEVRVADVFGQAARKDLVANVASDNKLQAVHL